MFVALSGFDGIGNRAAVGTAGNQDAVELVMSEFKSGRYEPQTPHLLGRIVA